MAYKDRFSFAFHAPTKVVFGAGAMKDVQKEMDGLGMARAMVVTDVMMKQSKAVTSLREALGDRGAGTFAEAIPDSSFEVVSRGAEAFKKSGADGLISIGGGSSMDTAKAIGILASKGREDLHEFLGLGKIGKPIVPHIAIPTTSGTGSEVTMFVMIKDHQGKVKHLISDPHLIPPVAILDPLLTLTLPPNLTAATGMDAMSHAIESFHGRGYEPIADGLAHQAIRLIVEVLPRCLEKGEDVEARGMQAIAATMAGMAFQNALVGCVHAMAHALGGIYGVHHGLANSILLPHGMRFNLPVSAPRYRQVGEAFSLDTRGKSDQEVGELVLRALAVFTRQLGLPQRLSEVGVPREGLGEVAKNAVADLAMRSNIRKVTDPQEILPVLLAAW